MISRSKLVFLLHFTIKKHLRQTTVRCFRLTLAFPPGPPRRFYNTLSLNQPLLLRCRSGASRPGLLATNNSRQSPIWKNTQRELNREAGRGPPSIEKRDWGRAVTFPEARFDERMDASEEECYNQDAVMISLCRDWDFRVCRREQSLT